MSSPGPDPDDATSLEALYERIQMFLLEMVVKHCDLDEKDKRCLAQFNTDAHFISIATRHQRTQIEEELANHAEDRERLLEQILEDQAAEDEPEGGGTDS